MRRSQSAPVRTLADVPLTVLSFVWEQWNAGLVKELKTMQAKDGGFSGSVDTSLMLLSLPVNSKFLPVYER